MPLQAPNEWTFVSSYLSNNNGMTFMSLETKLPPNAIFSILYTRETATMELLLQGNLEHFQDRKTERSLVWTFMDTA
jgi:hypothetical protein